jgi:hypothetical protein
MNKKKNRFHSLCTVAVIAAAVTLSISAQAYQGMPMPKLHVSGKYLQDPNGTNVLLHGWFQPGASYFNGLGHNYNNPSDFTSPAKCTGAINFYNAAADIMSKTNAQYGTNHGWYCSFVRFLGDGGAPVNFAPGWDTNGVLFNPAQFNGWINNILVPYVTHCKADGLYVVICGNPGELYPADAANPGGDPARNMTQQYQTNLITFWQAVANAPGIKSANNVMFEICNEPVAIETSFGANNWGSGNGSYWSALKNFMQPIVNAIRNTGADNVILVPPLGYSGECQGFASYPITNSNVGYIGHLYPGYGNVHNNATAVQNLWNSNYKPAANLKPLVITEMYWYTNNGVGYIALFNGSTAGFGNAVKSAMDNQGNVSYVIGFLSDDLTLNSGLGAATLDQQDGAEAAFAWWQTYTWAAPSAPLPPVLAISYTGNTFTVSFGATNGATYNLIYTSTAGLTSARGSWTTSGSPITGNGGPTNFTDTTTDPNRFYSITAHW